MCLYPKLIKNRKYTATKKNGGVIPAVSDIRTMAVPVACGRCMECRKKIARDWQVRLLEDLREWKNGTMVTLTFSDESIKELIDAMKEQTKTIYETEINEEGKEIRTGKKYIVKKWEVMPTGYELDNEIATLGVRRFTERWRKQYKYAPRHWLVTELGHEGTENIHLHGLVWSDEHKSEITKHWKYGHTVLGTWVNEQTVNYSVKYIHKQDLNHKEYKPKVLSSDGIGANYLKRKDCKNNEYKEGKTKEYYKTRTGHKTSIPTYWRNKIYTEEEKEKLWIEKIDEQIRWVNGLKVDISKGEELYYKTLEEARKLNKQLGYQTDEKDWNRKKYEEDRRIMLTKQRIERAEESLRGRGDAPASAESVNNGLRPQDANTLKPNKDWK